MNLPERSRRPGAAPDPLLKRVFAVDVLSCHRCGGRREVLALITEGSVVRAILDCLGLPTEGSILGPLPD